MYRPMLCYDCTELQLRHRTSSQVLQNRQIIHYKYVDVPADKAFYSAVFVDDGHYIDS